MKKNINNSPINISKEKIHRKPELMAPAGNWAMLSAVVNAGADAVYFGVEKLNMRTKAANFKIDELNEIVEFCRKNGIKTYLTLNTIVHENEIIDLVKIIKAAKISGINKIICWDFSVIEKCKEFEMPFCISTQASVSNSASAKIYQNLRASRIVLARECTLDQIIEIRSKTDIEIEAFIHGAMCIAVSGRCFMSHHLFGKSANRGECIQPCRREFEVYDKAIDKSLILGEDYVLSPKDLCTVEFIDKLIEAGIDSFKIEGRKRSPEYASKVVSVYREAIDLYFEGKLTEVKKKEFLSELEKVYNRGFSSGFYFGIPTSENYANIYGSKATTKKEYAGKVLNYYKRAKTAYIKLETGSLQINDEVLIVGPTTGVVNLTINNLVKDEASIKNAAKGDKITFPCNDLVRHNDLVYIITHLNKN